jgi:hypothetical protein
MARLYSRSPLICWLFIIVTLVMFSLIIILGNRLLRDLGYDTRRPRRISFPIWPNCVNRLFLPRTDSWYYVRFSGDPDFEALDAKGIPAASADLAGANIYAFYMSRANASFLLRSGLAELSPVKDKVIGSTFSLGAAGSLMVMAAPDFNITGFPTIELIYVGKRHYLAMSGDLERAAALLSKCPAVYTNVPQWRGSWDRWLEIWGHKPGENEY